MIVLRNGVTDLSSLAFVTILPDQRASLPEFKTGNLLLSLRK